MVGRRSWLGVLFLLAAAATAQAQFTYPVSGTVTQGYYDDFDYNGIHGALDIGAGSWTAIGASRSGTVTFSGWSGGYGNLVIIDHGAGYTTYYGHQVQRNVSYGQWVSTGQTIGWVGSTGYSTGPHLHLEIRRWGAKQYIPGWGGLWVNKGGSIPYSYPGLSGGGTTSGTKAVKVTTSVLNVRTGAGTGYAIKGQVYSGQHYISSAASGGWYKIWYDGTEGWISGGYASAVTGVSAVKVTTDVLNVRNGPGTGYSIAGQVYVNQLYFWTQYAGLNGWYKIYWRGGLYYIYGGYTTTVQL